MRTPPEEEKSPPPAATANGLRRNPNKDAKFYPCHSTTKASRRLRDWPSQEAVFNAAIYAGATRLRLDGDGRVFATRVRP
jgi:hypothetical protein